MFWIFLEFCAMIVLGLLIPSILTRSAMTWEECARAGTARL